MSLIDPTAITLALGGVVGFVLAITGAGGAVLSLPLLVLCLQIKMTEAAPIALLAIMLSSGLGAVLGLRSGDVRYKAAGLLALFGILFAPIGVTIAHQISETTLKILFSITLFIMAWRSFQARNARQSRQKNTLQPAQPWEIGSPEQPECRLNPETAKLHWTQPCTKRLMLTGGLSGLLSGLLGVGGGFVIVPALQRISDLNSKMIVSTSLAVVTMVSMVSAGSYASYGNLSWEIAWPFIAGTMLGMVCGRALHSQLSEQMSVSLFALLSCSMAMGMLASTLL